MRTDSDDLRRQFDELLAQLPPELEDRRDRIQTHLEKLVEIGRQGDKEMAKVEEENRQMQVSMDSESEYYREVARARTQTIREFDEALTECIRQQNFLLDRILSAS